MKILDWLTKGRPNALIVVCNECKCLVLKQDAQVIPIENYAGIEYDSKFYCQGHKKPWDKWITS